MLSEAELVEQYTNKDGIEALRLTAEGNQVGQQMAMSGEDVDAEAVLDALLDSQGRPEGRMSPKQAATDSVAISGPGAQAGAALPSVREWCRKGALLNANARHRRVGWVGIRACWHETHRASSPPQP